MLSAPKVEGRALHHPTTGDGAPLGASPAEISRKRMGVEVSSAHIPTSSLGAVFHVATLSALQAV